MANITVSANTSTISVNSTLNTVTVSSTPSTINVGTATGVSNVAVRSALSVTDTGGDGSLTYNNITGVFTYTGPNQAEANSRIENYLSVSDAGGDGSLSYSGGVFTYTGPSAAEVRAHFSSADAGGDGSFIYDSGTGIMTYTGPSAAEVRAHLSATGNINYDANTGVISESLTTTDITEGDNQYFTTARARGSISATSPLSYDSGTGVISISEIGDIESVTAGTGLTGGGNSGNVTLNVGSGYGITVNADNIELTNSIVQAQANIAIGNNTTDNLSEGSTNLYFTNARANTVIGTNTTDNLTEGSTNLYYTTGRANSAIVDYIGTASNAPFAFGGNITVSGDVIVSGNLDYENVTDLYVQDQKITLNANAATDATVEIIANRPVAGSNTLIRWNESTDKWQFTNDGSTFYNIPASTSDLAEGTNLYYTDARSRAALSVTDTGGDGSLAYNNTSGVFTFTGPNQAEANARIDAAPSNVRAHISATGNINYNSSTGVISESLTTTDITEGNNLYYTQARFDTAFGNKSTSDLSEGTNLYYTTARANTAIDNYTGSFANAVINTTQNITTTGNITGGYISAGNDGAGDGIFIGDINGAVQQEVKNSTGAQLDRGKAVYLTGTATGSTPHVALADNSNASLMPVIGIVKNNIPDTETGEIVTSGEVNIGAHGFAQGSDLFVNGTGDLQVTAPTGEANLIQKIGKVVSSTHIIVQGAFRTNATPNLNQGNIFLGDTNNRQRTVTPDSNFTSTGNAFSLSNTLTDVNAITSENNQNIKLSNKGASTTLGGSTFTELNKEIDSVNTVGLQADPQGFAIKSLYPWQGLTASNDIPATDDVTGLVISGSAVFTAGSNVVQLTGLYTESAFSGGGATRDLADYYANGMVLVNTGISSADTSGNRNRPITYPLSESARTIALQSSTAGGVANVIMNEVSPITTTWVGNFNWDRTISHTITDTNTNKSMYLTTALSANSRVVSTVVPVSRNDYFINDTGTMTLSEFDSGSVTNFTGANISTTGFNTAFGASAHRRYKKTKLRSVKGSTSFANVVLIGNDAGYDDSGFGYNYWPTFGMTTLWNGTDSPGNDTGTAQNPSITPGLRFIQFTDKTMQDPTSANPQELSTGGPRILLNSSQGNISLNPTEYYPRVNQGLGVFGVYGSTQTNPFPRTRSQLPGGIYFTASENWTANTGTDAYFVSTPNQKVGTDTDANEAHMFMASNNGETTIMATSGKKVSFFASGNAYAAGNIVGGYNAIKAGVEWANITTSGIQTSGNITSGYYFGNASTLTSRLHGLSTTDLAEGTNLYYTQARFDTAFGNKTTSDLTEGTNLYYTVARANTAIDNRFTDKSTTDLAEGTNLYYTTGRANLAIADYDGAITNLTGNVETTASIKGDNTVLKKFNETAVDLGNQSGDISSLLNATNGSIYEVTATGGITINSIANAVPGTSMTIIITQDGTGSHALTSSMIFSGAGSKTLSTLGNSIDIISVIYDGTTYYATLTKDYQ